MTTLVVRTTDNWTTTHPDAESIRIEGDELVYDRETELMGRHSVRLDLADVLEWRVLAVHSGLER
jgi:hypothetical protein